MENIFVKEERGQSAVGTLIGMFIFILIGIALLEPIADAAKELDTGNLSTSAKALVALIPTLVVVGLLIAAYRGSGGS